MAKKHKNKKRFIPQGILTRETASNSPALGSMQQRTISFEAREINETERTVHVSFSSEAVVPRFWGTEVLCHDKDCVDLTRLTELGVSLFNHNRDKVIGVIKNPILNEVEKRCHCDIYFDDDEDSDKIFQKVKKGILRGVSVGYQVDRWEEVKTGEVSSNGRFKGPCFVATKWTPLEVSIVSVPADTDVGVNRTIEEVNKEIVQRTERREIMDLKELCRSLGIDYDKLIAQGLNDDAIRALCSSIQQKREADKKEDEKKKSDEKAKADKKAEEEKTEKEKRAAEIASETQRSVEISTLCRDFGEDAIPYIKEGKSVEEVRSAILAKVKAERAALPGNVQIVDSEREKIRAAAVDGLLLRSGVNVEKPADGANNFRGMKMRDLAIECLEREGVSNAHRLNDDDLFRRAVSPDSQFTSILDNTVKKSMATAYKAAEPTYDKWCGKGSNSDFKEAAHYQLSEGGDLIQLSQSGEIKFDEMTDNKVTKKVLTYARGFGFTRQALINDDLSVLTKVPAAYVRAAMRGRNKLVYKLLGSNAAIYDGKTLFHADHKNKGTAGALSTQTLSELIKLMRKQKNIRGKETLNIKPEFLIVPAALEATDRKSVV